MGIFLAPSLTSPISMPRQEPLDLLRRLALGHVRESLKVNRGFKIGSKKAEVILVLPGLVSH